MVAMKRLDLAEDWIPHAYQARAVTFLMERNNAALFLDPGLGKTSSTLAAFVALQEQGMARKMLVVAPKRVCYLVWRQEGKRWKQFEHLNFSLLHGNKKEEALHAESDVHIINPEGVPWLVRQFKSPAEFAAMYDTVVIDELTKFKNPQSKRWKTFYPYASKCVRRWGLTGTPAPNGLFDLFGQIKMLDDGNALGKYITKFRDNYFIAGYDGYSFRPRNDADVKIQDRLRNIALRMKAEDYLELPDFVDDIRRIELDPKSRKQYTQMKQEMVADLDGGAISADNVAGVYSKLKQMAGGAVYRVDKDGKRTWVHLHDAKLDALEELIEELNGNPLLVAYEFNHELERILARFGDIPYLGKGTTDKDAVEIERAWNANEIPVLPVHPASSGHGLNLQKGSAHHICWFNPTWDFELYDQLVRRLYRQGSKAHTIFNHILAVDKTIDFLVLAAIQDKDTTQARLVQGLGEILETKTHINTQENDMSKLPKSGWGTPAGDAEKPKAAGWGAKAAPTGDKPKPAGWGAQPPANDNAAPEKAASGWGAKLAPAGQNKAEVVEDAVPNKATPVGWGAKVTQESAVDVSQEAAMEEKLSRQAAPEPTLEPEEKPKRRTRKKVEVVEAEVVEATSAPDPSNRTPTRDAGNTVTVSLYTETGSVSLSGTDIDTLLDNIRAIAQRM